MNLAVVGAGNIGLITAVCFAEKGFFVACADIDTEKIQCLKNGKVTLFEPELENCLHSTSIHFTTSVTEAVGNADAIFVAVGTPFSPAGETDLSAVEQVVSEVSNCRKAAVVIIRSTVPPGTNTRLSKLYPHLTFISSPEFLQEGNAIKNCRSPERIIYGSRSKDSFKFFRKIYEKFPVADEQILIMSPESAELSKYAANTFLAARVSLINEFSRLCDLSGADIKDIQKSIGTDHRIGPHFINAGLGFGGSCLPKDVDSLISYAKQKGESFDLLQSIKQTNHIQFEQFAAKVLSKPSSVLTLWGLSFKPNTDDLRDAPALKLAARLLDAGSRLKCYDPKAGPKLKNIFKENPDVHVYDTAEASLENSDTLIICTEWDEFINYDLKRLKSLMKTPVIFDGRNIYDPAKMKELGFEYHSVGRPS